MSNDAKEQFLYDLELVGFDDGIDYVYHQVKSGVPFTHVKLPPEGGWIFYGENLYGKEKFLSLFGESESEESILGKMEAYRTGAAEGASYTINVTFGNKIAGW